MLNKRCWLLGCCALTMAAVLVGLIAPTAGAADRIPNFCFLQVSDMHLSPWSAGAADPFDRDRSTGTLRWVCEQAAGPQSIGPANLTTAPPAFVIATGDLTEFGVINRTWDNVMRSFEALKVPVYMACGNHDNTWTSMLHIMQERHGGDHYSFDKFGCHFVGIDTATPQEPLPSIDARTITWLEKDLAKVRKGTPIFLFCHHPLGGGEFSQPYEVLRLLDPLAGHRLSLVLMGHGHGAVHQVWENIDCVMGGSTFGPNTGYSIISIIDGTLRVTYRYKEADKPMQMLLEKPLLGPPTPQVNILKPDAAQVITGRGIQISAEIEGFEPERVVARLDRSEEVAATLTGGRNKKYSALVSTQGLAPGAHFLRITGQKAEQMANGAISFIHAPADSPVSERRIMLPAGVKAAPLMQGDQVFAATTAGQLYAINFASPRPRPQLIFDAGSAILHTPALADKILYFGAADKNVYAVSVAGRQLWKCTIEGSAFGTPALDDQNVYVGDLEGYVHAIDRSKGKPRWSKRHPIFSIEQPLLLHDGTLYFGAWDGFVYAVKASDGSLKWKAQGPAGQVDPKKTNRYYSPADCAGLIAGDRLFFADRGYHLGSYSLEGQFIGGVADNISGIGVTGDRSGFYARGTGTGLTRFDAQGKPLWNAPVKLGRFPIPPTETAGKVYVCSNEGVLSAHDAASGKTIWEYQVTPLLPVMAGVAADDQGQVCVAGMDGSVTVLIPGQVASPQPTDSNAGEEK